jgi:hypothetical protein
MLILAGPKARFAGQKILANLFVAPVVGEHEGPHLHSRIGLVLVTPAMLQRLPKESVTDKELSALPAGNQLVPIVHNTTYEAFGSPSTTEYN